MKIFSRYLKKQIERDLSRKMVFIGGPRQVGKTTLASALKGFHPSGYLNWDLDEHREKILRREWPETQLWVFDEIHKFPSWRNMLKGLYDAFKEKHRILITGSARLDIYRRSGDSLQGRYHFLRLHPLSVAELDLKSQQELLRLLEFGGFPEPYFEQDPNEAKRWSREYRTRVLQDDLTSLERIYDLGHVELLMLRLPELVGSPLSINALREDLQVSHVTVSRWLSALERLYVFFRISPFGAPKIRAVKKEQKHYHFDWTLIEDQSLRFENMVACHLLKWVHFQQDVKGEDFELRYFRDIDGREIDFIITNKSKPIMAIEAKWDDAPVSPSLKYFKARFPDCDMWQISAVGKKDYISNHHIRVSPALPFLKKLV